MDPNIAAWMIAGGPRIELESERRDREQLHAFRESQRIEEPARRGLLARLRGATPARETATDLACCPA
jgi:hypothetical protein